jgi:anti-sigma factor RsiW
MCDVSEKLIAWLDGELPEKETADIERHAKACAECRVKLDAYKNVDRAFGSYCEAYCNAYCDPAMSLTMRRKLRPWLPALAGIAATVALLLIVPHGKRTERVPSQAPVASSALVFEAPPKPSRLNGLSLSNVPVRKPAARRHTAPPVRTHSVNWVPADPTIEIAIPAAAMFAPGAVPDGVSLTAEFTVAPDGTAQRLHLRP